MFDKKIFNMIADAIESASSLCGYYCNKFNHDIHETIKIGDRWYESVLLSWTEYPVIDGKLCDSRLSKFDLAITYSESKDEYSVRLYIENSCGVKHWVNLMYLFDDAINTDIVISRNIIDGKCHFQIASEIIHSVAASTSLLKASMLDVYKKDDSLSLNHITYWTFEK